MPNWPKPLSQLPGHEQVDVGRRAERLRREPEPRLHPAARRAAEHPAAEDASKLAPSIEFPIGRLPWRDATSASPPGALFERDGKTPGDDLDVGQPGVDYRWEHSIVVVDANGNLIEDWTQWDKMLRRPHAVYISPYDPEKNVWIVDDYRHAIFKFSNDGKRLLQTIGEPNVHGADDKHFYRPTFMAWLPDGDVLRRRRLRRTRAS